MTRIDFYSLEEGSRGDRLLLTCRLVERIHQLGQGGQAGSSRPANQGGQDLPGKQADAASEAGFGTQIQGGPSGQAGQSGQGNRRPPRIHIQVSDPILSEHLDRLLWTFDDQSFLPHGRIGQIDSELTPILIGAAPLPDHDQILINLDPAVPPDFARFERLCEPLDPDPAVTAAGRERFRYYRDRGYPLHHHKIRL